ncbi:MAG: hypothetical protein OCD01_19425, partial [Fibrobacterales bacterium]
GIAMDMSCENGVTNKCVTEQEILCAEVLRADLVRNYNTHEKLIDGVVTFVDYSTDSKIMNRECLFCSNDELIKITGGEMLLYIDSPFGVKEVAPLDSVIEGVDEGSGLPIKTFYFNIETVLDTALPIEVMKMRLGVSAVRLWNDDKNYIQEFRSGDKYRPFTVGSGVALDSIIDLKEMGSVCTHPACL